MFKGSYAWAPYPGGPRICSGPIYARAPFIFLIAAMITWFIQH